MYFDVKEGKICFRECETYSVANPIVQDFSKPIEEAMLADLQITQVRAIYPMINAINSGRLTKNYTFYPAESLIGAAKPGRYTGYSSFVKPFGKPMITEHRAQDAPDGSVHADVPMGRLVAATFLRRTSKDAAETPHPKQGFPGSIEGNGTLKVVGAVTEDVPMRRILGGAYHTVSIGSKVEKVIESISGKDLAELMRKQEELPPYQRGQLYNGQLSYLRMGAIEGRELSYVNTPSDERAFTVSPDIGLEGLRLLVGEKKQGKKNEFEFFDAKTHEKIDWNFEMCAIDESQFVDSAAVGNNVWWINGKEVEMYLESEDENILKEGSMVTWGAKVSGQIVSIHTEGMVPDIAVKLEASTETPIARIQVYNGDQPTDRFVGQKLSSLRPIAK